MKKIFSFIAAILFAGSMMAASYSMTPDKATTGSTSTTYVTTLTEFTHQGMTWKINNWNPSSLQIKTNQSSPTSEFRFYNATAFSGKITKVVLKFSALELASTSSTGFMFVGGAEAVTATTDGTAGVWDENNKTITWEPASTDNFTYFAFYQDGKVATGTNKLATADAIVVTYESTDPYISATPDTWNFGAWEQADGDFVEKTIKIQGANLTGEIALNFMGALFSVVPNRITPDASGNIDADVTIKSALGWVGNESYDLHVSSLATTPDFEEKTILTASINVVAPVTNCATASTAALAVSGNNVPFGDGSDYTVRGYVTEIAKVWDSTNKYISFWIADAKDGGKVIQAYHAACETEAEAPKVGDLVDVTGKLTRFNKTPEFAEGCTFKIVSTPTAIDNTEAGVKANKVLRDGVLLIEKNGVLYNAQGAVVR